MLVDKELQIEGRTLYLSKNSTLTSLQLTGEDLKSPLRADELCSSISTDDLLASRYALEEPTPSNLGRFLLNGFQNIISEGDIKKRGFGLLVAGESFGRGSSRIHAPLAIMGANIQAIAAVSAERIFVKNCIDLGIPVLDYSSPEVQEYLTNNKPIPQETYLSTLKPLSRLIVEYGGLIPFTKARLEGKVSADLEDIDPRPMTVGEKIIAKHAGKRYVRPGQQLLVGVDEIMFYDIQSIVTKALLKEYFPEGYQIPNPEKAIAFEDHLALVHNPRVEEMRRSQREFTRQHNIRSYEVDSRKGIEGICHTVMTERHVLPGDLMFGNDSHTGTSGVNNAYAIGGGALETIQALLSNEIIITIPETIRFNLTDSLRRGVTAQDLMLEIGRKDEFKRDLIGSGRMFEYGGKGLDSLSHGQQAKLTNLAIEIQGYSGIVEGNEQVFRYIQKMRKLPLRQLRKMAVYSDEGAEYFKVYDINLATIEPMVALPGDTQNGIPLSEVGKINVDIAYIGSCSGGRIEDLIQAAEILQGRRVNSNVKMYLQASSKTIYEQAQSLGLLNIFRRSGAEFILPGCGACMGMGPGTSEKGQRTISSSNRNFKKRMGNGDSYIASAYTVAASAVSGYICSPEDLG